MQYVKNLLIVILFFHVQIILAEGTRELSPVDSLKLGSLILNTNYTNFAQYGASAEEQIKIRVASTSEIIYFGLNNRNERNRFIPDVPFRIVSPSGKVVYNSVIPELGQPGNIATWLQAYNGPKQLGSNEGYDALSLHPQELGDYIIEIDAIGAGLDLLNIHFFDVTVANNLNQPILGRVHSQGWQISTGSFVKPFYGKVYPYDGGTAVYEVDFNIFNPYIFVINFNSTGTGISQGNDFLLDRKSQIGNFTNAEYEVFLNPPDEEIYKIEKAEPVISSHIKKDKCDVTSFCYSSNSIGYLDGFLDFNNNGIYEEDLGEVYFSHYFSKPGDHCFEWNEKDAKGNKVQNADFKIMGKFGFGITHLPLYDVEHNRNGYKVNVVRPKGASSPLIFWDDSNIRKGNTLGDLKVNLQGCNAQKGCHKWENRGEIRTQLVELQETINTWWYSTIVYDTLNHTTTSTNAVRLSFDPNKLSGKDSTICKGDSVNFYVYNDGTYHFNTHNFNYEWYVNGQLQHQNIRSIKNSIHQKSIVVIKSTTKDVRQCSTYDTLRVNILEPLKITGSVLNDCGTHKGSIVALVKPVINNMKIEWTNRPDVKSLNLANLAEGTYPLKVSYPNLKNCHADTVFRIIKAPGFYIDRIETKAGDCNNGIVSKAEIFMKDNSKQYQYSWDQKPYKNESYISPLAAGKHTVVARETATMCIAETSFVLTVQPLHINLYSKNENCRNGKGEVTIHLPKSPMEIQWNGMPVKDSVHRNLKSGTYPLTVYSKNNLNCRFDTTIAITNIDYMVPADFTMEPLHAFYQYKTGEEINFVNLSGKVKSSLWQFGDGNVSNDYHTSHEYKTPAPYTVRLDVTDSNGCKGTAMKQLRISDTTLCALAMPNAFSPNRDGINDIIKILGFAHEVDLKVFNRWGEVIFRTMDIEIGWDGFYRNEEAPIGSYPFILEYTCPELDKNKKFTKVGDITLVR